MAKAQREGGLYYTDKGVAVDAEGKKIEGAPKQAPDTDPSKQPGAVGALTSEERLGVAIATAMKGGKPASTKESAIVAEDEPLPTIRDLPDHVAGLKTVAEVKAMAKRDDRVSAEPIYDARIAELEAE
jgi:hypothetical protein